MSGRHLSLPPPYRSFGAPPPVARPHETGRDLVGVNPARLRWLTTFSLVVHTRDAAQLLGSRTHFDPQPRTVHHRPMRHPIEWCTAVTARHDKPLLPLPVRRRRFLLRAPSGIVNLLDPLPVMGMV